MARADQGPLQAGLWIVATPIGSLGDLTPRARQVLAEADLVLAEDTRRVRALLSHAGISSGRRLRSLHEHNEENVIPGVVESIHQGKTVALVSDAGTPVLADPGYRLVRTARDQGLPVFSVPGPSAFTAGLAAAGQAPLPATLVGFLPPRGGPRRRRIGELAQAPWALVILLSPHRLRAELEDLAAGLGAERPASLLAELSKLHERAEIGTLGALARGQEAARPRGEYVLVVGPVEACGPENDGPDDRLIRQAYERKTAEGATRRDALRAVAHELGVARRRVFDALRADHSEQQAPTPDEPLQRDEEHGDRNGHAR